MRYICETQQFVQFDPDYIFLLLYSVHIGHFLFYFAAFSLTTKFAVWTTETKSYRLSLRQPEKNSLQKFVLNISLLKLSMHGNH